MGIAYSGRIGRGKRGFHCPICKREIHISEVNYEMEGRPVENL